jgi:chitin-binding protein
MNARRRLVLIVAALGVAPAIAVIASTGTAGAHGSMSSPASRVYTCWQEGAESPDSAACRAAVSLGGTQPIYDWNEINQANAAGNHRAIIPDGRLCSAGRDKYRGFDLARADWPSTSLPSGGSWRFTYRATAPHRGSFEFYITRSGYSPTTPLRWSDLDSQPFFRITDPPLQNGSYVMNANLPVRSGRHLIFTIWQRSDSPEAFYTCSDVVFGGGGNPPPPPTPPPPTTAPPPPPPPPTTAPPGGGTTWAPNTFYAVGARVTYAGRTYQCRQAHTSLPGWEPSNALALWLPV